MVFVYETTLFRNKVLFSFITQFWDLQDVI